MENRDVETPSNRVATYSLLAGVLVIATFLAVVSVPGVPSALLSGLIRFAGKF